MTSDPVPGFPLAAGHRYGSTGAYDSQVHDGSGTVQEQYSLKLWQREYAKYDRDMVPSGAYDGPTQRACIAAQRACGLTITGDLDRYTWDAVFDGRLAPEAPKAPSPVGRPMDLGKLAAIVDTPDMRKARERERSQTSAVNKIMYRNRHRGEAPDWYGLDEPFRTAKIRAILGLAPGKWTHELTTRVKGIQRTGGVPVTGDLDKATAWLLNEVTPVVRS